MWVVGKTETVSGRFFIDGIEQTGGTATVQFRRNNAGTEEWLQANLSSFSASVVNHSATFIASVGWQFDLTPPISMAGFNVVAILKHSSSAVEMAEAHFVYAQDPQGSGGGHIDIALTP